MILLRSMVLGSVLFSIAAMAQTCPLDQENVVVVLKESFRANPNPRDGTHHYFLLTACTESASQQNCSADGVPCNENAARIKGTVYFGKEADQNYRQTTPVPLPDTTQSFAFDGIYSQVKEATHGDNTQILSDDGSVQVQGNFYANRDISFKVAGNSIDASLLR